MLLAGSSMRNVCLHFPLSLIFPSSLSSVVGVWEKDISVHPLPLPQSSCEELQKLLVSSTSRLPSFLRCMNSYQVIYRSDHTHAKTWDCLVIILLYLFIVIYRSDHTHAKTWDRLVFRLYFLIIMYIIFSAMKVL